MRRPVVLTIAALVVVLVSCSDDEQASSTTQDQTTVAVEDAATTMTSIDDRGASTTDLPAASTSTSTVTVTVTGIEEAIGFDLAGVVRKIDRIGDATYESGVGGFGVVVDTDPFATTQVVRAPDVRGHNPYTDEPGWPWVADEPAILKPGTYDLQLWLGQPPLCCFSPPWVPADSPSLSGCRTDIIVKEDEQVNITVSGIPPRSTQGPQVECPTG
jgi:hypothetical protein